MKADQNCLICGRNEANLVVTGTDRLYGTTSETFGVVRCHHCGMLRLSPRPDPVALFRYYPANYWFDPDENRASQLAQAYRRLVLRDHIGFVSQAHREGGGSGPLLDVGCGGGLLAGMLRERGIEAYGLDFSPAACALAWNRHHVPAVTGDLVSSPFTNNLFGTITLFHVLEHLPDPKSYLAAVRELLTPAGRLVVQVPNADSWQFRLLGKRWNGLDIPRHLNDFRTIDVHALLASCGFDAVRTKHFSWRDNPAGLATSLTPVLDPMSRRIRGKGAHVLAMAAYFSIVAASIPFTALEAAFGHGSSVMVECRKR